MSTLFISYRRADSRDVTERLYDRLVRAFSSEAIFKDVDSIIAGTDFRQAIDKAIDRCCAALSIIGPIWHSVANDHGVSRLHDPDDLVRIELESALRADKTIVPILVADAKMPAESDLPKSIAKICWRHAFSVRRDPDFHHDVDKLILVLEGVLGKRTQVVDQSQQPTNPAVSELVAILRNRAAKVVEYLEKQRDAAVQSCRRSWFASSRADDVMRHSNVIITQFQLLHLRHLGAIEASRFTLAHEIVNEIHCLLFIQARHDFWVLSPPGVHYHLGRGCFGTPASYSELYPGECPAKLEQEIQELGVSYTPPGDFESESLSAAEFIVQHHSRSERKMFSFESIFSDDDDTPSDHEKDAEPGAAADGGA